MSWVASGDLDLAVVVAVVAVGVVQVAIDQVIDVVAVRHRFVAAAGAVAVALGVLAAVVAGRAGRGVGAPDRQGVLLDRAAVLVVQVAVVQVVGVAVVLDGRVAAVRPVLMGVAFVVICHASNLPPG